MSSMLLFHVWWGLCRVCCCSRYGVVCVEYVVVLGLVGFVSSMLLF